MRKGEATRTRIVEEAARQAALRGLAAVSLGDVAQAVGLSKSGLFKHFESKEAMELAVVEHVTQWFTDFTWRPAADLPTARERLARVFELWLDWEDREWAQGGCPIMAFSVEVDDQPGPVRDLLQKRLRQWKTTLVRQFQQLREPPLSDAEAQSAYFQMKSFALGHLDARRIMGEADARRSAQAAFDALLDRTARAAA
ncbi:TetR/AcrR family transcriptional regulator [Phenylobacterium sp.]|uniref:TetR/AcrR family transcriptional regulator n=1 Tax=Phenylobacterium sp. TaxID=1871053 RepID=UPI00391DD94D